MSAAAPGGASTPPPRPHGLVGHLRATGLLLALLIVLSGFLYPAALSGVGYLATPASAGGSLLKCHDGTIVGSADVAQNLSAGTLGPDLFWARPSLTDYNTTLGAATPPGPSDPALARLLNETIAYMRLYGNLSVNATIPIWWVAPSASSLDPELVPEAVLVQVPRVAASNNLTVGSVLDLVNAHIVSTPLPYLGVAYVNVLELDLALLESLGKC
jgi:K+-transporting ATPase ATPase C chain